MAENRLEQTLFSLENYERLYAQAKEEQQVTETEKVQLTKKLQLMGDKDKQLAQEKERQASRDRQILETVTDLLLDVVENRGPDTKALKEMPEYSRFGFVLERLEGKIAALGINSQVGEV